MSLRKVSRGKFGNIVVWMLIIGFGLGVLIMFTPNLSSSFNQAGVANPREAAIVVNGEEISQTEFAEAYNNLLENYIRFYQQFGQNFNERLIGAEGAHYQLELRSQVADQLIRNLLLEQEAKSRNVSVPGNELDASVATQLASILVQNNLTEQRADEILRGQNSSLRQFKTQLREQANRQLVEEKLQGTIAGDLTPSDEQLIQYAQDNKANTATDLLSADSVAPSDEELLQYYQDHQEKYLEVRARHLLIKVAETAPQEELDAARQEIQDLKRQLDEGADFAELAKAHSQDESNAPNGGDLGFFGPGAMVKPFEEAAFALEVGQASEPVQTTFGFHLIKVEERRVKTFDDVKATIQTDLEQEKRDAAFDALMEKAKAGDAEALGALRETIEEGYLAQERNKKFEEFIQEVTAKAGIEIKMPELAAFRLEATDPDAALATYEKAKADATSSDPYLDYYIGQLYQKKHTEISDQLKELQDKQERTPEEEAQLQALTEQGESARKHAAQSLLSAAQSASASEQSLYEQVLNLGEDSAGIRYSYALTMLQTNNRSSAIAQLTKAIELDATFVPALILYGDLMAENANFLIASEHYEKALAQSDPTSRSARDIQLKLARAYMGLDRFDDAQKLFDQVLAGDAKNATALAGLGDLKVAQQDYQAAIEYFQKSLDVSSRADVRVKLGSAFLELGDLDKAQGAFEAAQKSSPYLIDPYRGLGQVYQARGDAEQALEQFRLGFQRAQGYEQRAQMGELVVSLDPNDLTTRFKLADIYKQQHVFQKSIEHYNEALRLDPNSAAAYWGLAESYEGRAEYDTAKTYYKSALTIASLSADDRIRTYESIVNVEEKIVGFQNTPGPDGLDAHYQLAALYLEKGDTDNAKGQLDKLIGYDAQYRMQDVAMLNGRLEEILSNKPGEAVADQGRDHIQPGTTHDDYTSTPPTSGPHYPTWADWGIYAEPIQNELQIHNLEHGGIVIQYQPELDQAALDQLTALVREMGSTYKKLILAPYPDLDSPIALTAWTRIEKLQKFNADAIRAFAGEYIDKAPEKLSYDGTEWWLAETTPAQPPQTPSQEMGDQ